MKTIYRQWISRKLKKLREDRQFSQSQIAQKLNKNKTAYQAYEDARAEPNLATLVQIFRIYGITPNDFFIDTPAI